MQPEDFDDPDEGYDSAVVAQMMRGAMIEILHSSNADQEFKERVRAHAERSRKLFLDLGRPEIASIFDLSDILDE